MTTHTQRALPPLVWIAGIAIILFSMVGIAAFMGWIPSSIGNPGDNTDASTPVRSSTHKKSDKAPVHVASNTPAKGICSECGVIQSTRVITQKGDGGAVGIVGGAVVGGLLGNQIGDGKGKDIATVAGAVGGAVAGNEIQKRVDTTQRYETVVRFNDGTTRAYTANNPTGWRIGDKVKVINGVIQSNS